MYSFLQWSYIPDTETRVESVGYNNSSRWLQINVKVIFHSTREYSQHVKGIITYRMCDIRYFIFEWY